MNLKTGEGLPVVPAAEMVPMALAEPTEVHLPQIHQEKDVKDAERNAV